MGPNDSVTFSSKSNYLQVSAAFATIGSYSIISDFLSLCRNYLFYNFLMFGRKGANFGVWTGIVQLKWAKYGLMYTYDKILLSLYGAYSSHLDWNIICHWYLCGGFLYWHDWANYERRNERKGFDVWMGTIFALREIWLFKFIRNEEVAYSDI